jgi:hypothetical protein
MGSCEETIDALYNNKIEAPALKRRPHRIERDLLDKRRNCNNVLFQTKKKQRKNDRTELQRSVLPRWERAGCCV